MLDFKSRVAQKVLNYYFLNENKKAYINELARMVEEEAKNVYRILVRLEKTGILASEFNGKERYFYANRKSPVYKGYKTIFLKTVGLEELLKKALKQSPGIKEAYIYGSYAKNMLKADSDIDLLLIGGHNVLETQRIIHRVQKQSGREINVVNMTGDQLKRRKNKDDQLIKSIFEGKNIKLL